VARRLVGRVKQHRLQSDRLSICVFSQGTLLCAAESPRDILLLVHVCVCACVLSQGYRPTVFYPKPSTRHAVYSNLATQCEKADIPSLMYLPSDAQLVSDSYSLVVDAIFGVGFQPPISSDFSSIVHTITRSKVPVVSVDVPTGQLS